MVGLHPVHKGCRIFVLTITSVHDPCVELARLAHHRSLRETELSRDDSDGANWRFRRKVRWELTSAAQVSG